MPTLAAFASGLVFGLGLILSGMVDPGKVLGFLDLAGAWDPSLALVMGGAVAVAAAGFALAGALRSNQLPRLSFADAAQVLELGPRELAGIAAALRRGEGLALAGLLRADGEALARRPLPELS